MANLNIDEQNELRKMADELWALAESSNSTNVKYILKYLSTCLHACAGKRNSGIQYLDDMK